ncbi:hypothetical protein SAMN05421805_12757 [Saccharopolyspora antimicrobica]|uniref:Uncharacterized protein n=1 Tax=Saccharopolyspora antimicrobica TaxID=455193 RepID=A0A1I5KKT2_9PSEU|nr:hypothetical protein [Saccharopolyspora antimicrobica]RKT85639.1 hypothetical protein ATL45_3987 [Saccharopolyspora antimicrobica]SFO85497.1 hypothetical protein SAMN05421805_12757 [Saccharopolyspora antimicrobica]
MDTTGQQPMPVTAGRTLNGRPQSALAVQVTSVVNVGDLCRRMPETCLTDFDNADAPQNNHPEGPSARASVKAGFQRQLNPGASAVFVVLHDVPLTTAPGAHQRARFRKPAKADSLTTLTSTLISGVADFVTNPTSNTLA